MKLFDNIHAKISLYFLYNKYENTLKKNGYIKNLNQK